MSTTKTDTRWRLSRADGAVMRALLVVMPVAYPALVIVPRLVDWASGRALQWGSATSLGELEVPELSGPGVDVTRSSDVVWALHDASAGQWIASLVPAVLTWALLVAGCAVAWRLDRAARSGQPFGQPVVRGLRLLGVVVLAYGVLVPAAQILASMAVLWSVDSAGELAWLVSPASFWVPFTVGLLIVVVAECFRLGQRLSDDVEGLV